MQEMQNQPLCSNITSFPDTHSENNPFAKQTYSQYSMNAKSTFMQHMQPQGTQKM